MENQFAEGSDLAMASGGVLDREAALVTSVFGWMTFGLVLTGVVGLFVLHSPSLFGFVVANFIPLIIAELVLVFALSLAVNKMSAPVATGCFVIYSASNGLTLAPMLSLFSGSSIASAFMMTGALFGTMAVYGHVTKRDLSTMGSFMMMGLIGGLIATVVNMVFLQSAQLDWIVSIVFILACTGLTAWDVQKVKKMAGSLEQDTPEFRKAAIIGALELYLNFIIIFQNLLSLMDD